MPIITSAINIKTSPNNVQYYKNLNYNIPTHLDKNNNLKYTFYQIITVQVKDLLPQTKIKVLCQCDNCAKQYMVWLHSINKKSNKILCKKCSHNTQEFKEKNIQIHTGKKRSIETKIKMQQNSYWLGKIGDLHPTYKKNLSIYDRKLLLRSRKISQYIQWKEQILQRDNYTCQKCGSKKHLHVHHINNFNNFKEQRTDINNGITLCFECHLSKNNSIHNLYGRNTTYEHLIKFIQNI
jgi:hypothetical protein